jgi:outer membrane beta-barrel protein
MSIRQLPLLLAAMLFAAPAFGQAADPAQPAPGGADATAVEPAPAADPVAAEPAAADPAAAGEDTAAAKAPDVPDVGGGTDMRAYGVTEGAVPMGGTLEWAIRRKIRVMQKRAVLKQGRHGLSLNAGVVPNDDFFAYVTGALGYSYFFSEDLALELNAAYTYPAKTSLEASLEASRPDGPDLIVRLPETLRGYTAASVTWYVLHGKLGFFTTNLIEFDVGVNFGVGANATFAEEKDETTSLLIKPNGNIGLAMLFYVSERWAVRWDYKQLFYPMKGGGVAFPISTTLGLAWFTAPLD